MYSIDVAKNEIHKLKKSTFSELGFKERENLQEWIAKEPSVLGEELLIIQKEFSGFDDTNERLDLLALDKQGAIVIIENKLDDSGRDVTWQSQKYASYCSNLSKESIRQIYQEYLDKTQPGEKAEDNLVTFFEETEYEELNLNKGVTQRIMMIAGNFRKEVTSTVLWLLNFKLRIQCFKATPYTKGDELFLNIEQIIPTIDAEEFMIGMADKAQDEIDSQNVEKVRDNKRRQFWAKLLPVINAKTDLFINISPNNKSWISAGGLGISGVAFCFAATKSYGRAELWIGTTSTEQNKSIFDQLYDMKNDIESSFGDKLEWERLDSKNGCRIKAEREGNIFDENEWDALIKCMTDSMMHLEQAIKPALTKVILER